MRTLKLAVIDLEQTHKDPAGCEPKSLSLARMGNLKRLVQELDDLVAQVYAATPQPERRPAP
jgi:hypothetical protein